MIQIIAGKKGSGKTKRLIAMTNQNAKEADNNVIFIDDDNSYMYDIDHNVRFVNATDFKISSGDMFIGFLCGMLASNYDIGAIYVDGFAKLCKTTLAECEPCIAAMDTLGTKHDVKFVLSVSEDIDKLPEFMKPFVI